MKKVKILVEIVVDQDQQQVVESILDTIDFREQGDNWQIITVETAE